MADDGYNALQNTFNNSVVDYPIIPEEKVGEATNPISLDIDDDELVKIIDKRIEDSKNFYKNKYDLPNRRRKNETYLFGRQISERERKGELRPYESRNLDNVMYEIEASIVPLAMSKMPDMMVTPGSDTQESQETAESLSKFINSDIKKRQVRRVLELAFRHIPVYFVGVIKARWDPTIGESGDYVFSNVHPDNIVVDHTATTSSADDMDFVAENVEMTVQELTIKFPSKKADLYKALKADGLISSEIPTWKDLATPVKIWEVWNLWYKKAPAEAQADDTQAKEPSDKWERVPGVIWKYKNVVLAKMKDPNFDWEGAERVFTFDDVSNENSKRPVNQQDMNNVLMTGVMPPLSKEQVYYNYFQAPRKPYFFMTSDQWGKQPLDETSRIEQNIKNQENLDTRQKQINETLNNRGKHVFSKDSGIKAADLERMDLNDPMQDILVEGNVNNVHSFIQPERPTAQEFNSMEGTRNRMYAIAGSNAIRGTLQSDVATNNQIAREADFTRADLLVENTINAASEWLADWTLQFIKLRYTENHMRKLLGKQGQVTFMKLHRDMIDDGMEVIIRSSSTDKVRAQRNAMDFAKLGPPFIDPINFFKDMDVPDPEGRTAMGMTFGADPATYQVKYVMGMNTTEQQVDGLLGPGSAAQLQGQPAPQGAPAAPPMNPTPQDTAAIPTQQPPVPQGSPRLM